MRVAAIMVAAIVAGCGEPTPLACVDDITCGHGACVAGFCADPDPACASGLRYHESAGELAGDCTGGGSGSGSGSGSGIGNAEIQPLGENTIVDASNAHDDVQPSCAAPGGRDVVFDVTITGNRRLYVDTYGTSYGVVLAVYKGRCSTLTPASVEAYCVATSCSDYVKQWSEILTAGDYCVVVDQSDPLDPADHLVVRSKLGLPSPLGNAFNRNSMLNTSTTCTANQVQASCNLQSAGEAAWFFMTCGGMTLAADTCDDADYQGYLTVLGLGSAPLACTDGCSTASISMPLSAPSPAWVVADDITSMACSPVSVYVTLQ